MNSLHKGQIAECLVTAKFCELGLNVSVAPSGCRYDLVVEIDSKLYRVQVKSSAKKARGGYVFWGAKNRRYEKGEFDLLACVALDLKMIAFVPPHFLENATQLFIRPPESGKSQGRKRNFTMADCTLPRALELIKNVDFKK